MEENDRSGSTDLNRRRFCQACIGGMGVASGIAVAYPVVAFLGSPTNLEGTQTVKVPIADLTEDQARYLDWQGQQVVLLYTGRTPKAFSASCTHLGCIVAWDNIKHEFHCPCHGAAFDDQGHVISGPVSKALPAVPFKIADGNIVFG